MIIPDRFWELDCLATPDDDHRLWLGRDVDLPLGDGQMPDYEMLVGLMLNPSRARGEGQGDPTQRKWHGFAKRLGAARYGFLNLFSESSPYPEDLFTFSYEDSVGDHNDEVIRRVFEQAAERNWPVVCGWGKPSLPKREFGMVACRALEVLDLATAAGVQLYCFHTTDDGWWPRHPLMLGYEHASLKPFTLEPKP